MFSVEFPFLTTNFNCRTKPVLLTLNKQVCVCVSVSACVSVRVCECVYLQEDVANLLNFTGPHSHCTDDKPCQENIQNIFIMTADCLKLCVCDT